MGKFIEDGYQIIKGFINKDFVDLLKNAIADRTAENSNYGIRNLHYKQRRTIHLEYSSPDLPQDLAWYC